MRIADGMEEMKGNYNSLLNESVTQKISIEKLHSANINLQNQLNASFKERSKLSALVPLLKSPDRSSNQHVAAANVTHAAANTGDTTSAPAQPNVHTNTPATQQKARATAASLLDTDTSATQPRDIEARDTEAIDVDSTITGPTLVWNAFAEEVATETSGGRLMNALIDFGTRRLITTDSLSSICIPRGYKNRSYLRHCLDLIEFIKDDDIESNLLILRNSGNSETNDGVKRNAAESIENRCASKLFLWDRQRIMKVGAKSYVALGKRVRTYWNKIKESKNLSTKVEKIPLEELDG